MTNSKEPKIKLIGYLYSNDYEGLGPEEISEYGALGCFEEKSSLELFLEDKKKLSKEKFEKKKEKIFQETSGRGHGSVLDQNEFVFSIENLPRITTFQLCLPQYLEHLQQSLRRADAIKGFYLPKKIKKSKLGKSTFKLLEESFKFYEIMCKNNIPIEDARYILPLYTKTNIQTKGNARELMHIHDMSQRKNSPSINKKIINDMVNLTKKIAPKLMKKRNMNYEMLAWYPAPNLFSEKNETLETLIKNNKTRLKMLGSYSLNITEQNIIKAIKNRDESELANLKHIHFTFLSKMSLTSLHQAIRQRTWDQSVESIYHSIKRGNIKIPPTINRSKFKKNYINLNKSMIKQYNLLINNLDKKEVIGIIPHSIEIYDLIHINGWNALHSIGKRTCTETQWEIRAIANKMAKEIKKENPILGKYVKPQGVLYGQCPERNNCGLCDKILKKSKLYL